MVARINSVAVYCGSSTGTDPAFAQIARATAEALCARSIDLVYGGGRLGLMGILADAMLERGGKVVGVIPQALIELEVAHTGVSQLVTVETMHERKAAMTDLSDAFLILPGGIGTLDEMFEAWSWNALGYHSKPFCLLNVAGFWDQLIEFVGHATTSGFLYEKRRQQMLVARDPDEALDLLDRAAQSATKGMVW